MRNSQHKRISLLQKLTSPKVVAALVALTLVCCFAIGGTIAWLVTETDPVVNTFTYGDINITLTETDTGDNDNNPNTNKYVMVPGHTITKDPKVTFKANSEDAWLFVKLEKTANFDDFMIYEIADGWTALQGVDGVYYREVSKVAQDTEFTVIKDDTVTVKGEVTKEMLNALDANGESDYPKLIVTAYAVQKANINTVAEAWEIGKGN
ncbi:MAG: hypothetical protein IKK65_03190 [Clostridia bacterium]|nr:hypothetical protein [Clostridia bacterium]